MQTLWKVEGHARRVESTRTQMKLRFLTSEFVFTGMYYLSRDVSTAAVLLTSSRFTRTVNRVAQLHVVRCFVDSIKQKKAIESFTGGRKEERQLSNTRKLLMDTKLEVTYFRLR